jgi:hypothetical protein
MARCGISIISSIPANKVNQVIADFNLDDPKPKINKKLNSDGTTTVTADYGECDDGSTPRHKKKILLARIRIMNFGAHLLEWVNSQIAKRLVDKSPSLQRLTSVSVWIYAISCCWPRGIFSTSDPLHIRLCSLEHI